MQNCNIPAFVCGLVLFICGIVLLWGGLNLPGTTGHDGSWDLTAMTTGASLMALGFGSLAMMVASREQIAAWRVWITIIPGLLGVFAFMAGFFARAGFFLG